MKEAIDDVTDVLKNYPRTTIVESMQTNSDVGTGYYSKFSILIFKKISLLLCCAQISTVSILTNDIDIFQTISLRGMRIKVTRIR